MSDPVADKSGFLRMYMSNHPDTLIAYARWHGKVMDTLTSAEMTAIDSKSMTLTCKLKDGSPKVVKIVIEPPLSGYDEVKPRLIKMKAEAQEGLGMIKAPQISTFRLPPGAAISAGAILLLCYCTYFPRDSTSPLFRPARFLWTMTGGDRTMSISWAVVWILHGLESLYTFTICRKHHTGFITGVEFHVSSSLLIRVSDLVDGVKAAYVLSTALFGFPIWSDLRKRIQAARIASVMKTE